MRRSIISEYNQKNVLYIGYIGTYNNEHIFKYGLSNQIFKRNYVQHQKTYDKINLHHVVECDNNKIV
jgi:hypothetical protein